MDIIKDIEDLKNEIKVLEKFIQNEKQRLKEADNMEQFKKEHIENNIIRWEELREEQKQKMEELKQNAKYKIIEYENIIKELKGDIKK
jgi:hypothetical protein